MKETTDFGALMNELKDAANNDPMLPDLLASIESSDVDLNNSEETRLKIPYVNATPISGTRWA